MYIASVSDSELVELKEKVMSNCLKISSELEVPKASCWGRVEVNQTMQRAVEKLLDVEHEPALRFLKTLRKRIVQVEKEGSPPFSVLPASLWKDELHSFRAATDAVALDTTSLASYIFLWKTKSLWCSPRP